MQLIDESRYTLTISCYARIELRTGYFYFMLKLKGNAFLVEKQ